LSVVVVSSEVALEPMSITDPSLNVCG